MSLSTQPFVHTTLSEAIVPLSLFTWQAILILQIPAICKVPGKARANSSVVGEIIAIFSGRNPPDIFYVH